jgi:hypothetical protein
MLRNDYIMRMIEQFINALAQIQLYKKGEDYLRAFQASEETFQQLFGVNSAFFNMVPTEDLLSLLQTDGILDRDKTIMIAALLKLEGDIYEAQKDPEESSFRHLKSLDLYLEAFLCNSRIELAQHFSDIGELVSSLEDYELPEETNQRLWRYYEKDSQYAKAEDIIYALMENGRDERGTLEQGIYFYERLINKSDRDLIAGNLPRDEVEDGLAGLKELRRKNAANGNG